jgi:non-canonical poly(A) RNA polymerase PAPD5/7
VSQKSYKGHLFDKDKAGRLTIIDPNRSDNNISGGTRDIDTIQACFSSAHQILEDHLTSFDSGADNHNFSFLKDLIGGNFAHYDAQRLKCRNLYFGLTGKEAEDALIIPPPPPPTSTASMVVPFPPVPSQPPVAEKTKPPVPKKVSSRLSIAVLS